MTDNRYSLDTSALIDGLERYYPPASFPGLWDRMDSLLDEGRLFASEEVWEEAQTRNAAAQQWMEPRRARLLVPTGPDVTTRVREILDHPDHRRLVMQGRGRNRADPFVIAVAELQDAIVVTGEGPGSQRRPKIPTVCNGRGVPCISFTDIITAEGWMFA